MPGPFYYPQFSRYLHEFISDGLEYRVSEIVAYLNSRQDQVAFTDKQVRNYLEYHNNLRKHINKRCSGSTVYYSYYE